MDQKPPKLSLTQRKSLHKQLRALDKKIHKEMERIKYSLSFAFFTRNLDHLYRSEIYNKLDEKRRRLRNQLKGYNA
jgi:hypothetical protein